MPSASKSRSRSKASISINRLKPNIGAQISGIDLRQPLSELDIELLNKALVEHQVLVFRDQDISTDQQIAFARNFSELTVHPFSPNFADRPEVIVLDYSADNPPALTDIWHSDETYKAQPPMATMLRAKVIPELGGDTVFASMSAAYRGLSEGLRNYIAGLNAIHDFKPFRKLFTNSEADRKRLREIEDKYPPVSHPVARIHPVSGEKVLFVNPQFTLHIEDMDEAESRALLDLLFRQAAIPEYQLRLEWQKNTLVFWDNRSVQHYAVHDYYPQRRLMERVTLAGDQPFGESPPNKKGKRQRLRTTTWSPNRDANSARPLRQFERGQ